jgi:hypothetical protein
MSRAQPKPEHNGYRDQDRARRSTDPGLGVDRSVLDLIHDLRLAEATRRRLPRGTRAYEEALAVEAELRHRIRAWNDPSSARERA